MPDETIIGQNVTVTPVNSGNTATTAETIKEDVKKTAETIQEVLDGFPDDEEISEEEAKKAHGFLDNFMSYIKSAGFKDDVMKTSKKYKIPPKQVAQGFFSSCLGTIGDILGIAISTVGNAAHTLMDLLSSVVHGGINLAVRVAQGLASIVTLNKTNACPA